MTDEEIVSQFRKLRAVQKEQLSRQLYPKYTEEKDVVLEDINKQVDDAEAKHNDADDKYRNGGFLGIGFDALKRKHRETEVEYYKHKRRREILTLKYESECEYCTKLKEFDIETEQMILAHMCEVQLICGNKKALPMLE